MSLGNSFTQMMSSALKKALPPTQAEKDQVARDAAASVTASSISAQAAAATGLPPCVTAAQHTIAASLCAQKRVAGHEAVAAFGRTLGATDPAAQAMALAPCEWAALPTCKPDAFVTAAPKTGSASSFSKTAPPRVSAAPSPALSPVAPAPSGDTRLIVGGVLVGALVLGGVYMLVKKKDHS